MVADEHAVVLRSEAAAAMSRPPHAAGKHRPASTNVLASRRAFGSPRHDHASIRPSLSRGAVGMIGMARAIGNGQQVGPTGTRRQPSPQRRGLGLRGLG
jgi:hypothetical protein